MCMRKKCPTARTSTSSKCSSTSLPPSPSRRVQCLALVTVTAPAEGQQNMARASRFPEGTTTAPPVHRPPGCPAEVCAGPRTRPSEQVGREEPGETPHPPGCSAELSRPRPSPDPAVGREQAASSRLRAGAPRHGHGPHRARAVSNGRLCHGGCKRRALTAFPQASIPSARARRLQAGWEKGPGAVPRARPPRSEAVLLPAGSARPSRRLPVESTVGSCRGHHQQRRGRTELSQRQDLAQRRAAWRHLAAPGHSAAPGRAGRPRGMRGCPLGNAWLSPGEGYTPTKSQNHRITEW